jgi:hypothetical protein
MTKLTRTAVLAVLLFTGLSLSAQVANITLRIDAAKHLRTFDPRALTGTNVAVWTGPERYESPLIQAWLQDLAPGSIRMPGGSFSDIVFWNGNGMRGADGRVDPTCACQGPV